MSIDFLTRRISAICLLLAAMSGFAKAQSVVGTLPGNITIDNKGFANYAVTLKVPAGRGAMEPTLGMNYNSQGGNGLLGVGWTISTGFPNGITRGRSILARDGMVRGVNFDSNDKLYLDGKRLICIGGTYGAPGSSYRTEVDSFETIVASGTGSNITAFIATDKGGTKYYFGQYSGTSDGYQGGMVLGSDGVTWQADTLAYTYALKRVEDTLGNYISFIYANPAGGEFVVSEIDYTGSSSVAPAAALKFTYGTKPDATQTFLATRLFNHSRILQNITGTIKPGATPVTTCVYNFSYSNAAYAGHSRLTTIATQLADPATGTLQTVPSTTVTWQNPWQPSTDTLSSTPTTLPAAPAGSYNISEFYQFGDTVGNGQDSLINMSGGVGLGVHSYLGDIDGDGKKDIVTVSGTNTGGPNGPTITMNVQLAGGGPFSSQSLNLSSYFADPPNAQNPNVTTYLLLQAEGEGVGTRVTVADYTGDGLDDVMIHGFDGCLYLFESTGNGFKPVRKVATGIGGGGEATAATTDLILWQSCPAEIKAHTWVTPMPCDLNGDGRTDYVCIENIRAFNSSPQTGIVGYQSVRSLVAVMSNSDGTFSGPYILYTFAGIHMPGTTMVNVNSGFFAGDFNGDGLMDYMVLDDKGIMGYRWVMLLNTGCDSTGAPRFTPLPGVIPNSFNLPSGAANGRTYYNPLSAGGWNNLNSQGVSGIFGGSNPALFNTFMGLEGAAGSTNTFVTDVNHDGIPDLVWYVGASDSDGTIASGDQGWYAYLGTGTYSSAASASTPGAGFAGPYKLSSLQGFGPITQTTTAQAGFTGIRIMPSFDYDGDGHTDYIVENTANGTTGPACKVYLSKAADGVSTPFFMDQATSFTDGLGRTSSVAYLASKDSRIYTKGASVSYPIHEFFSSSPVTTDLYVDSGSSTLAHYRYQYSGRRLDLSGRGDLGFHSFVTLDTQTNLFKYQFLTQSFPMTGLTAREQTYHYLGVSGTTSNFRLISSHDNTVVADMVSNGSGGSLGTLFPFVSQAIESRWEDSSTANVSVTAPSSGGESAAETLFPVSRPPGAHIAITATSLFDNQTTAQLTLPQPVGGTASASAPSYNASDTLSSGQNSVVGSTNYTAFSALSFPTKITYGNVTTLTTDYGDGHTEQVATVYQAPTTLGGVPTLSGLPQSISTTVTAATSTGFGSEIAPQKRYTYAANTPLVLTEIVDGTNATNGNSNLSLQTTYTYNQGRVASKTISSPDPSIGSYQSYSATAWDAITDKPTAETNVYGWSTTTTYDPTVGLPNSVKDVNGVEIDTQYDALGRALSVKNLSLGLTTTTNYSNDTTQTIAPPSGVGGLSLTSTFAVTTTETVKPTVTTYYDRLARPIRTIKTTFNSGKTYADTVYNVLGQTVATSLPYAAAGSTYWTTTTYDPLGRPVTVTSPNGKVTTTTYNGRATQVSVTAPPVSGAQINSTVVDSAGHTVGVWNADNVPTFSDTKGTTSTSPSIAFALDGFGLMRTTTLAGQSSTVSATYDAFAHQISLNDPDKGNWSYTNNALGEVLGQTDPNGNITTNTFDPLGRPLSRTTTSLGSGGDGSTETASWYYYDQTVDSATNRVALGTQGWIGSLQRSQSTTTGNPGYAAPPTVSLHFYDNKGRANVDINTIDNKWFYTYTNYLEPDGVTDYSRVTAVRHFWRPAGHETPSDQPYMWQDFGYTYTYDNASYLTRLNDSLNRTWWQADPSAGYDYMDRPVLVTKGSGYQTQRTYDATAGTLTGIKTGSIQNLSFGYDGLGNLTSRGDGTNSETFTYDLLSRLSSGSNSGSVSYASNGNVTAKTSVTGVASNTYTYDLPQPHAVHKAFGYTMGYDANGNLTARSNTAGENWNLKWTGFDKPRWMVKTTSSPAATVGSEFSYNANRSRVVQLELDSFNGTAPTHYTHKRIYALGSTLEINYDNLAATGAPNWTLSKVRIYIPGPDGIIGAREFLPAAPPADSERALVYHYDHLGSIQAVTLFGNTTGSLAEDDDGAATKYSYEPWGQRRNPNSWSGAPTSTATGGHKDITPRGFTSHEMLDDLGLVHMNGRIYDPLLGRMLSADVVVQFPGTLQSYNRYSYVRNNPLSATDPSGFVEPLQETPDEKQKRLEHEAEAARNEAKTQALVGPSPVDNMLSGAHMLAAEISASAAADKAQTTSTPAATKVQENSVTPQNGSSVSSTPPTAPNSAATTTTTLTSSTTSTNLGVFVATQMKPGDIVVYSGNNFIQTAIEKITPGKGGHVAIALTGGRVLTARPGDGVTIDSTPYGGGSGSFLTVYRSDRNLDSAGYAAVGSTLDKFAADAVAHNPGYSYVFGPINAFLGVSETEQPICSEVVLRAALAAGEPVPTNTTLPGDFTKLEHFKQVWP